MIGTWEFSNAARDKKCTVTFKGERSGPGLALAFDPACAALFPLLRDVTAWKYPQDDLLFMLNAQGNALIQFSEAEDGVYEAPTPGLGVLFLQAPGAAAGPAPIKPEQIAGAMGAQARRGQAALPVRAHAGAHARRFHAHGAAGLRRRRSPSSASRNGASTTANWS